MHMNLYWVTTSDGDENWFVLAGSKKQAEHYFVHYEGYNDGAAHAQLIKRSTFDIKDARWAQVEDLNQIPGVRATSGGNQPRTALIDGHLFTEGALESIIRSFAAVR